MSRDAAFTTTPVDRAASVSAVEGRAGKSLSPDEAERVRDAIRSLLASHANQTELAKALGVTQQTISAILAGTKPAGVALARSVAERLAVSFETLIGAQPRTRTIEVGPPCWKDLQGWEEAAALALARGRVPAYAIQHAGQLIAAFRPEVVTTALVERWANFWLENTADSDREAVETAEIEAQMKRKDAEAEARIKAGAAKPDDEPPKARRGKRK